MNILTYNSQIMFRPTCYLYRRTVERWLKCMFGADGQFKVCNISCLSYSHGNRHALQTNPAWMWNKKPHVKIKAVLFRAADNSKKPSANKVSEDCVCKYISCFLVSCSSDCGWKVWQKCCFMNTHWNTVLGCLEELVQLCAPAFARKREKPN